MDLFEDNLDRVERRLSQRRCRGRGFLPRLVAPGDHVLQFGEGVTLFTTEIHPTGDGYDFTELLVGRFAFIGGSSGRGQDPRTTDGSVAASSLGLAKSSDRGAGGRACG